MNLYELLDIRTGVTSMVGGGGKSTTLSVLSRELMELGSVICCTTTHFFPLDDMPLLRDASEDEVAAALKEHRRICLGDTTDAGKLGESKIPMARLMELADYVLVEADGSKRLPCKAHLDYEPIIPPESNQTIMLVGSSGFRCPIREKVHRFEVFCALTGASPEDPVTPEVLAAAFKAEGYGDKIFVNQAETPERLQDAEKLAKLMDRPVFAGSLQGRTWKCLS